MALLIQFLQLYHNETRVENPVDYNIICTCATGTIVRLRLEGCSSKMLYDAKERRCEKPKQDNSPLPNTRLASGNSLSFSGFQCLLGDE